jgi:hypothetical protein
MWTVDQCEFENSTADYLIHLESTGASLAPFNAKITNNNFIGGTVPILSSKAAGASQTATYVVVSGNKRGSGVIMDLQSGNFFHFANNEGTVNDTGGRFTTYFGGKDAPGAFKAINGSGQNDAVGGIFGAISSTGTLGKNLAGTATFATAASVAVSFGARTEPDANYRVVVSGNVNQTFWVTGKSTTGFTINSSVATSTAVVDWIIIR